MIKKRCPSCRKEVQVNPSSENGICSSCGEIYIVTHTLSAGTAGNSSGIRLKAARKTKICSKCGQEKPLHVFRYSRYYDAGLSTVCIPCNKEINKTAFHKNSLYRVVTI